ncbi:VF_A0006 family four-cysteine protein [Pseudomonas aeruginosa]|uniref:VF_A0006 family four-cysteine protein n=1 Tax=Pseudomonas aeruginosa TaxID=287 RepID=UPI003CC636FE
MDTIAMKFLLPLLLLFPLSALADDKDYDQCILDYQRTAKSGVAVHFITQACDKLYNDGSFLLSREKAYYECLLENLPGVVRISEHRDRPFRLIVTGHFANA